MSNQSSTNIALAGFLFGNIDETGRLENDIFDEEAKSHLDGLSILGIGNMVTEITDGEGTEADDENNEESGEASKTSNIATDYSDINELAEEDDSRTSSVRIKTGAESSDDCEEDSHLLSPTSWFPATAKSDSTVPTETSGTSSDGDLKASSSTTCPLAGLLPPEYANIDVTQLFPDFRPGQVLRFSRLFKPLYVRNKWKKKKKKKDDSDGPGDKTADTAGIDRDESRALSEDRHSHDENVTEEKYIPSFKYGYYDDEDSLEHAELGRAAQPDEIAEDDSVKILHSDNQSSANDAKMDKDKDNKPQIAEWRYGPAQLWYDMLGVDETGEGFNYGFKPREDVDAPVEAEDISSSLSLPLADVAVPSEAYYMVCQTHWEDDIIWNGEEVKDKVLQEAKVKGLMAGWIPSSSARTAEQYLSQAFGRQLAMKHSSVPAASQSEIASKPQDELAMVESMFSLLPIENEALVSGSWVNDIIWDVEQSIDRLGVPPVLTLDLNDENIILDIPEDKEPVDEEEPEEPLNKKDKEIKKTKMALNKAGILKEDDNEEEEEETPTVINKSIFNLSNDEFYNPKMATDDALRTNMSGTLIQHATPAVELQLPFFPTHIGPNKLRTFHRPPLKRYSHGVMSSPGPHAILPLLKHIRRKAKLREQERLASGGGDMFFMRTVADLSGKDGDLILAEYSEEFPPLMMQIGMATKIKCYYKRRPGKDTYVPEFQFGELAYAHTSPFLGALEPGQCLQAFENNMFRAPIYEHKLPETDFLVIRNRQFYFIREVDTVFAVGQECPLMEVPGPNSKKANNFVRDFLQVFVYRLFWKSKDVPRRIKMEEVKAAFPSHSESSIRKRLKLCSDFKRTGTDSNWWVLKSDFRLPSEEEIRALVAPEQCCAWYSMLAAEQHLKDAGYGEKSLFSPEDNDDEESQTKIEDEVKTAPWNTTRAYISAMKGKCLLSVTGIADPTGCGEGFAYTKVPCKPQMSKDESSSVPLSKRSVTGTDADLRRLSLRDAKQLLRKFGVSDAAIKKLSRWEIIDVVRTMSTEQAKSGQEGITKFARGSRLSTAEHLQKYKEDCQRVFDLQNKILNSNEVLSTDDESSSAEDSDMDELGKNIENMLVNKKTSAQFQHEREEAERRDLRKMLMEETKEKSKKGKRKDEDSTPVLQGPRKLIITRTFRNEDGNEYTRTEVIRKGEIIDAYVRIRQTKDNSFIRQFSAIDDEKKEEMKKERRRLQDQLRRIKKNQEREKVDPAYAKKKKLTPTTVKMSKMKCGACGQMGHMRTNRECPMYNKQGGASSDKVRVAVTEEQEEEMVKESSLVDEGLINVEGTKVKISKQLIEHADKVRRKALLLKFPKKMSEMKRKRMGSAYGDYLTNRPSKLANRRRADPLVTMGTIFEHILNEMKALPNTSLFYFPVNEKQVPDYYKVIKKPMDLQTIRDNIRNKVYKSREAFLLDVGQIAKNSEVYNGPKSLLTVSAQKMVDICLARLTEKEEKLMRLEKAINPLLDDNDMVALSYIFSKAIDEHMKTVENSFAFHKPVNKKFVKDYYDVIKKPMDLETLSKNVKAHKYRSREDFLSDVDLIYMNCNQYNGENSALTATALAMVQNCREYLAGEAETIQQLEESIKAAQDAVFDTDSVWTGTSLTGPPEGGDGEEESAHMNMTIAEDGDDMQLNDEEYPRQRVMQYHGNRDEDYIDIEGDENADVSRTQAAGGNRLVDDLQLSPENSDEETSERHRGNRNANRSESENDETDRYERQSRMDIDNTSYVGEYYASGEYEAMEGQQYGDFEAADDDGDKFDPSEFFSSFANRGSDDGEEAPPPKSTTYSSAISADLQLSESDSDDDL